MTESRLLIVIPCLNEESYLEKLVDDLTKSCQSLSYHIVICDGGSTDRTAFISEHCVQKYPTVSYLFNSKKIQAAAVNLAVEAVGKEADYLIRIDAHANYPEDYCRVLLHEAIATGADSVVVSMEAMGKTLFQKAAAIAQNSKLGNGGSAHRQLNDGGKWVDHGHHALMRLSSFISVEGYDENFKCNEDAELDYRLTKLGHKIWLTSKTSLIYYPRSTPFQLFKQYFGYGRGRAQNILKHKMRLKIRQLIPIFIFPALLILFLVHFSLLFAVPFALWVLLCNVPFLLQGYVLKDEPCALAGLTAMIMHTGWSCGFWWEMMSNKLRAHKNNL